MAKKKSDSFLDHAKHLNTYNLWSGTYLYKGEYIKPSLDFDEKTCGTLNWTISNDCVFVLFPFKS